VIADSKGQENCIYLQKKEESAISLSVTESNARVVDVAKANMTP
jgi:uncharacterized protein involved in exopolysaccharide biosynthesis